MAILSFSLSLISWFGQNLLHALYACSSTRAIFVSLKWAVFLIRVSSVLERKLSLYLWVMRRAYKTPSHLPLVLHHKHFFHYIITKTQKFYFCFSYNFRVTSSSLFSYSHCQKHEVGFSDQRTKNLRLLRKNGFLRLVSHSPRRKSLPLLSPVSNLSAPPWIFQTPTPSGNNGLALRRRNFPALFSRPKCLFPNKTEKVCPLRT